MSVVTKPKINFNEMISVSLNLDNLKKYIEFLEEQNKRHNEQMNDVNIKLARMEFYQHQTDDICSKIEIFQKKIEENENTVNCHSNKFMEIEVKSNELSEKFESMTTLEKTVNEHSQILTTNSENFFKLSRDVEINMKDILECSDKINKIKTDGENSVFATSQSVVDMRDQLRKQFEEELMYMREEFDKKINDINKGIFAKDGIRVEPLESEENLINNIDKNNPLNMNGIVENLALGLNMNTSNVSASNNMLENNDNVNEINISNSGINDVVMLNTLNTLNNNEHPNRKKSVLSNDIIISHHHGHKNSTQSLLAGKNPSITEVPYKRSSSLAIRKEVEILKKDILNLKAAQDNMVNEIKHEIKTAMMRSKRTSVNIGLQDEANSFFGDEINTSRNREKNKSNENIPTDWDLNNSDKEVNKINIPENIVKKTLLRSTTMGGKDNLGSNNINSSYVNIVVEIKQEIKGLEDKTKKLEENFKLMRNAIMSNSKGEKNNSSMEENQLNPSTNTNTNKARPELKIESFHIDTEPKAMNSNRSNSNTRSSLKTKEPTQPVKSAANIGTSLIVQDLLKQNETLTADINKLNEAISELKYMVSQVKTEPDNNEDDETGNSILLGRGGRNKRIADLERNVNRLKAMLEDTKGNDEVDTSKEEKSHNNGTTIKEMIKNNTQNLRVISDRVDKHQSKLDHLTNEILIKLKKDLSNESQKVLDEFKHDLKMAILKLDDQLKEKVDKYNFDEYGRKVDYKITNEISKKIDKVELKKNTSMMNKKIDHLETKISKTLVDTIIDLQLDEAPLIVKKGALKDKCVSCNQNLPDNDGPLMNSINKYNEIADRYKLKNIQEITNKLGMGSFSRILGNCQPDTIIDDLSMGVMPLTTKYVYKKTMQTDSNQNPNFNLPDISPLKTNNDKILPSKNEILNTVNGPVSEKKMIMNNIIHGELEKKALRGENLIKSVDKLYGAFNSGNGDKK